MNAEREIRLEKAAWGITLKAYSSKLPCDIREEALERATSMNFTKALAS